MNAPNYGYSVRITPDGFYIAEQFIMSSCTLEYRITTTGPERTKREHAEDDIREMRAERYSAENRSA